MANKTLKATVKLDTKSAEASLARLTKKINNVQNAIKKTSGNNNKLNTAINKAVTATNKLNTATKKVATTTQKVANTANKVNTANQKAANSARKMRDSYASSNTAASRLLRTMKSLAATYLGIMGMKAVVGASDTITSAENRLNNIEGGNPQLTQESMDKMYTAAQRSRSGYDDMLSNVSKTMTLAGDSFQNNIDNAIRFQEIMAKAYTIGGASAAEQASSMYQLVQALGSGILQGDELRSVREGAPIAYKEIEKFAQGVLNTNESLKELASQGKITSEMVVAAIMNAEKKINKSFENTKMTFAQSWEIIKNMTLQAFRPVLQMFNEVLNSKLGTAIINGIGYALVFLANTILWVADVLGAFFNWCGKNWYWLQWIVYSVVIALVASFTIWAAKAVWAGILAFKSFLLGLSPLYQWILVIGLVVAALVWMATNTANVCDFIYQVCIGLAQAIIAILAIVLAAYIATGTVMLSIPMLIGLAILGVIAIVVAAFVKYTQQIMARLYQVKAVFENFGLFVKSIGLGIANMFDALGHNIQAAMTNPWGAAKAAFWTWVANILDGIKFLEPAINAIAHAFGAEGFSLSATADNARSKANAANSEMGYVDVNGAFKSGFNSTGMGDILSGAYKEGWDKGTNIQNGINSLGDKLKNFNLLDSIADAVNFDKYGNLLDGIGDPSGSYLPGINDPAYALDGAYNPDDLLKSLEGIDSNVGDIKDSMDLSNDDLEYLRKIADMEWRNEFTTAEIKVDMTNNNTVTAERDLDGIVEYLSDVLRAEMTNVAYGVHY